IERVQKPYAWMAAEDLFRDTFHVRIRVDGEHQAYVIVFLDKLPQNAEIARHCVSKALASMRRKQQALFASRGLDKLCDTRGGLEVFEHGPQGVDDRIAGNEDLLDGNAFRQ